jgi:uridine kinase
MSDGDAHAPTLPEAGTPRALVVALTGGSASGKSTLAQRLAARLSHLQPLIVPQDAYFREWAADEQHLRTTNSPPALRWEALRRDLARWRDGAAAGPPPRWREPTGPLQPGRLVLLEGHLILWDEEVRSLCDLKVFLDLPDEERVVRRLLRDVERSGMSLADAAAWYRRDVLPHFWRYTAPARWWSDLVLPAAPVTAAGFEALVAAVEAAARRLQAHPR